MQKESPGSRPISQGLKLHHRLTLAFCLSAVIISGLITCGLYLSARKQIMEDIRHRLHDIVAIAAQAIDAETLAGLTSPEQEGTPGFMEIRQVMLEIRKASTDIYYIYTMRADAEGNVYFLVDGEDNPADLAHMGQAYPDAGPLLRRSIADMDKPVIEEDFYTDEWGTWLSGYAPVVTKSGRRAGVLGVDISAAVVSAYLRHVLWVSMGIFLLTLPLTVIIGYIIGRRLARPIKIIEQGAERIGRGELDLVIDISRSDEIGALAASFNNMTRNLKASRTELNELMGKYRDIFDNAVEGLFRSTPEGRFLAANRAALKMLGFDSFEDLSASVVSIADQIYQSPGDRDLVMELLTREGRIRHLEVPLRRRDGSEVWVELDAQATAQNGVRLIEGIIKDISERREKEKAEQERRQAEAASRAKSDFLANMSHEIRTPLNAVMGLTDLTLRTNLDPKQKEYLGKIKTSSRSLLALINDIMDLSKIEAGRMELEETDFSLHETMANLSEMFAHKAYEKEIELMLAIDRDTPSALLGDPVRLGQILINLVGNAIKFTSRGEILVSVRPLPAPGGGESLVLLEFAVKDTGGGIPPDRLEQIFDSFTQADSSTTRVHGGSGLGLSICRKLSRLMGGDIRVESVWGRGSTFYFTAVFHKQSREKQVKLIPPVDLRDLRVLVVDDNSTSREILTNFITSFRMNAVAAGSGQEAVDLIREQDFDLVLMDWKMPGLNGLEAARRIKQDLKPGVPPIICMISAYGRQDLIQTADRSLLDGFLHKPVNQSLLFDTIMELFGRHDLTTGSPVQDYPGREDDYRALLKDHTVLLVEDNAINQLVAREWLENVGLVVQTVSNGSEALQSLAEETFDLVLMDIQMPVMDGLEASRLIRRDLKLTKLPIVAMTAHALSGDRDKCLAAGMNDYITKPIDPQIMYSILAKWMTGVDIEPAPVEPASAPMEHPLPDLPGIDVKAGFFQANKNPDLYLKLLRSFLEEYSGADDRIAADMAGDRQSEAGRLAHSLKGVGGNIGAQVLHQKAADLEDAINAGEFKQSSAVWTDFTEALNRVLEGLKKADLSGPPKAAPLAAPGDDAKSLEKLHRLADLMEEDLGEAKVLLEELASSGVTARQAGLFSQLTEQVDDFDLDQAAVTLTELISILEKTED